VSQEGHGITPFDGEQGRCRQRAREEMQRELEGGTDVRYREFLTLGHLFRLDLLLSTKGSIFVRYSG